MSDNKNSSRMSPVETAVFGVMLAATAMVFVALAKWMITHPLGRIFGVFFLVIVTYSIIFGDPNNPRGPETIVMQDGSRIVTQGSSARPASSQQDVFQQQSAPSRTFGPEYDTFYRNGQICTQWPGQPLRCTPLNANR